MRDIQITKHLADVEVDEDSDAMYTCEINYPDEEVQWLLNDKVLFTNEVNTIFHEGKSHKLTLKNLAPQDGGTITFQVRKLKESVTLKVKGGSYQSNIFSHTFLLKGIFSFSFMFTFLIFLQKSVLCSSSLWMMSLEKRKA